MATQEEIKAIQEMLEDCPPINTVNIINETHVGMGAILKILMQGNKPISAGQLSKTLKVSTARVAVLLKKLEAKGLIDITPGMHDTRVKMVTLSVTGEETVITLEERLTQKIEVLIDTVGFDELREFIKTLKVIKEIMTPYHFHL